MSDDSKDVRKTHPVPAMFEHLGMAKVKPSDSFTITYNDGMLEASIKRRSGQTETVSKVVKGNGFQEMTAFDPNCMSKSERNDLIKRKHQKGESQEKLARKFGLTQSMISRIIRS